MDPVSCYRLMSLVSCLLFDVTCLPVMPFIRGEGALDQASAPKKAPSLNTTGTVLFSFESPRSSVPSRAIR